MAHQLHISVELAKKELAFWVSHGVIKESQLLHRRRAAGMGDDDGAEGEDRDDGVSTEIVYYAAKTLDRSKPITKGAAGGKE